MSLRIEKLHETIGAEITGVDLAKPLTGAEVAAIERAWLDHIVLVFPGQDLDQEAQLRFAGRFGVLGERSRPAAIRMVTGAHPPGVTEISQILPTVEAAPTLETAPPVTSRAWWRSSLAVVVVPSLK